MNLRRVFYTATSILRFMKVLLRLTPAVPIKPKLVQVRFADPSYLTDIALYVFEWVTGVILIRTAHKKEPQIQFLPREWTVQDINRIYKPSFPKVIEDEQLSRFIDSSDKLLDTMRLALYAKYGTDQDIYA
jgi:hypothetical protein